MRSLFHIGWMVIVLAACESRGVLNIVPQEAGAGDRQSTGETIQAATWAVSAGGPGFDMVRELVVDGNGDIVVAGSFTQSARFGQHRLASSLDESLFVAKLDPGGRFLWAVPLHALPDQLRATARLGLAVDAKGSIFVSGTFKGGASFGETARTAHGTLDLFVAKLDGAGGGVQWVKTAGGSKLTRAPGLALDGSGEITICGAFEETVQLGTTPEMTSKGSTDVFVARLDANGEFLWSVAAGSSGEDYLNRVVIDRSGRIVVSGLYTEEATLFGSKLPASGPEQPRDQTWVAALDAAGKGIWATSLGRGYGHSLAIDRLGNPYLAGTVSVRKSSGAGGIDGETRPVPRVWKLTRSGEVSWDSSHEFATSDLAAANGLFVDGDGNAVVVGHFVGRLIAGNTVLVADGASDPLNPLEVFVASLTPAGEVSTARRAGGPDRDAAATVAGIAGGMLYIAGTFEGSARFGATTLESEGECDAFVWKTNNEPL